MRRLAALLAVVTLLVPAPLAAQEASDEPDPRVRLVVTSITGVVGPAVAPPPDDADTGDDEDDDVDDLGLRVLVENEGEVDVGDLQVVVEVHGRVEGARSLLAQALDDQVVETETIEIERADVRDGDELPVGDIAGQAIDIDGDRIGWSGTNDVYPVEISVLYGAEVLDRVVTAVVHLHDTEVLERPLQTTVVWPVSAPTTRTAEGRYPEAVPDELAPGGRIDVLLAALERQPPEVPIQIAPEAELIEELADRADGFTLVDGTTVATDDPPAALAARLLQRLTRLVEQAPVEPVVGPYGRADVAALHGAPEDLQDLASDALETARDRTQQLLGRAPAVDLFLATTPLTPSSLELLDEETHLLLPAEQVRTTAQLAEDLAVGDARRTIPASGTVERRLATIADPRVTRILADPPVEAGPAVARQRLVAETALLHLSRPGDEGRSLLVMPPVQWNPLRGTAPAMLAGLLASPWLELGPPERPAIRPPEATLSARAAVLPASIIAELTSAREQLDALRVAMPDGLPDLEGQTVADLDDALLRALTPEALADAGAEALARIGAVRAVTDEAFGEVALPEDAGVTLTSDTGEVPVTLQRTRGGDIDLLVEVTSGAGLLWEEGGQSQRITLPEDSSRTVAFSARAAARGTFQVTVSVWDPTHRKLLDNVTMSVRSTAISRTALAIVGGVVLVLLAVGARRRRSPTLEVVR